jgi:hypothetical protein
MEALQAQIVLHNMSLSQLMMALGVASTLKLQPSQAWWEGFEAASRQQLQQCRPQQLLLLLQEMLLLHHQASVPWLQDFLSAFHHSLCQWDVEQLAAVTVALGCSGVEAKVALQRHAGSNVEQQQQWRRVAGLGCCQQWQQQQRRRSWQQQMLARWSSFYMASTC